MSLFHVKHEALDRVLQVMTLSPSDTTHTNRSEEDR